MILYVLHRQCVDDHCVDGGGEGGLGPGDEFGGDRSVDHIIVGEGAAIEGHTQGISLNFGGE